MTKYENHLSVEEIARRQKIREWADRDLNRRLAQRERVQEQYGIDLRGNYEP